MASSDHAATTLEMVKLMMTLATRPAGSFRYKLMVSGVLRGMTRNGLLRAYCALDPSSKDRSKRHILQGHRYRYRGALRHSPTQVA